MRLLFDDDWNLSDKPPKLGKITSKAILATLPPTDLAGCSLVGAARKRRVIVSASAVVSFPGFGSRIPRSYIDWRAYKTRRLTS